MEEVGSLMVDSRHAVGLVVAVVCGTLIGLERQLRKNPAGLHTNALVALGAASYVIAGVLIGENTGPARVTGQVITGVGFICAGLIWHEGGTVRGINSAATVWCSCAVGVFAGLGMILSAGVVTALIVFTNVVLHYIERQIE